LPLPYHFYILFWYIIISYELLLPQDDCLRRSHELYGVCYLIVYDFNELIIFVGGHKNPLDARLLRQETPTI
jgi:hypothetical protein